MTELQWKALSRIHNSQDGQGLLAMLKSQREDCRTSLEQCRDTLELARKQGEAIALAGLIEKLETAREVVDTRYTK
tara:strand:+ start:476 stop:703 length:228 start_codon:yes stop_codon:yes gene_type:complete